jgi:hypothetical protein
MNQKIDMRVKEMGLIPKTSRNKVYSYHSATGGTSGLTIEDDCQEEKIEK